MGLTGGRRPGAGIGKSRHMRQSKITDYFPQRKPTKVKPTTIKVTTAEQGLAQVVDFRQWAQDRFGENEDIQVIGCGSYGIVLGYLGPGIQRVLKMMPVLSFDETKANEMQNTDAENGLTEAAVAACVRKFEGFARLRELHIMLGPLPPLLRSVVLSYLAHHKKAVQVTSQIKTWLEARRWVVQISDNAGSRLPDKLHWEDAHSVLHQLVSALAKAEESIGFEHRDLSIANICVKWVKNERNELVPVVRIIDFGFSRCINGLGQVMFNDSLPTIDFEETYSEEDNLYPRETGNQNTSDEALRKQRPLIKREQPNEAGFQGYGQSWMEATAPIAKFPVHMRMANIMRDDFRGDWSSFVPITNALFLQSIARRLRSIAVVDATDEGRFVPFMHRFIEKCDHASNGARDLVALF